MLFALNASGVPSVYCDHPDRNGPGTVTGASGVDTVRSPETPVIPAPAFRRPVVEAACAKAMTEGLHSSDVIINILARDPAPTDTILTPDALSLRTHRWRTAPDTINSGADEYGANEYGANRRPRYDGHAEALRMKGA
jgi:hypothetical protein